MERDEKEQSDEIYRGFMEAVEAMVKASKGKLTLVLEGDEHFLQLLSEREMHSVEHFVRLSLKDKMGRALPEFYLMINSFQYDCPKEVAAGKARLKELGNVILDDKYQLSWNQLFR